jgi:lysosomal acid lipase/cholesteryl ester hydrolase
VIQNAGYSFHNYSVITSDGYILQLVRIPGGEKSPPAEGKTVVFLMHGLLCSSMDWLVLGEKKALPYLLADAGNIFTLLK